MAINVKSSRGNFEGYGLVRDKNGHPQFDDWHNIDKHFHPVLTRSDWEYIYHKREEETIEE